MASVQVISLGGSIIAPDKVDVSFLRSFRKAVLEYLEQDPERRLILVCGGGGPAREYQGAYRAVLSGPAEAEAEAQDWLGIAATRLNAELVRFLFQPHCPQPVVLDPTAVPVFTGRVLVAGGWKPGFSSDYDAVLLARRFQADSLVNLSNVSAIYSADPKTDPSARPLPRLRWAELSAMVGTTWVPGRNVPFDPVATAEAARAGLRLVVAAGRNIENFKKILAGQEFEGTVVGPA
ncbi:MAG: UMP kinase [Spirochaetes bacterium RBG_16_67_19]|nr:MAG: UMP kinase [Spirochaetes bacterium RBG_16_67_19]